MAARTMGSATISFGLVSVPVVMYSSSESAASVSFNMLHKSCGTAAQAAVYLPQGQRGGREGRGRQGLRVLQGSVRACSPPRELKALDEKATNTIDISEFVPLAKVDRIYLEKAYLPGPDKGG